MTSEQIEAVQQTSDILMSLSSRAADLFYDRLFAMAPGVRPLFPDDMTKQKIKLMDTLGSMISYMTHPDMFGSVANRIGREHARFGAAPEHYGAVGKCLLETLAEVLGPRFTPEARDAWAALYGEIARTMIAAQEAERARLSAAG